MRTPRFEVVESATPVDGTFQVRLHIRPADDADLARVERVIYTLHPALTPTVRHVPAASKVAGFATELRAWGKFRAIVQILSKDGTEERHVREVLCDKRPLEGPPDPDTLFERLALAKRFGDLSAFRHARAQLEALPNRADFAADPDAPRIILELALCTYKDDSLPARVRLERALALLEAGPLPDPAGRTAPHLAGALATTGSPEALGMAGAIHKRLWQLGRGHLHLIQSAICYLAGYEHAVALHSTHRDADGGAFTGVNACFVLDLAARAGCLIPGVSNPTGQASAIRAELVERLPKLTTPKDWWRLATLAEVAVGQRDYAAAKGWLGEALRLGTASDWQVKSTAEQLAAILQGQEDSDHAGGAPDSRSGGWEVLEALPEKHKSAARRSRYGKVGLALSGGGFRAAFYHLGVLARLAELDLLRHVEVLSCVSGGSIVGTHYYLALKEKLEAATDALTVADYTSLVREVATTFLSGVQSNIRMRVLARPGPLLASAWPFGRRDRTRLLGELYEEHIFSRVVKRGGRPDGALYTTDLAITPPGADSGGGYSPRKTNWMRADSVPILVLNATTLNTGHVWQFTASYMGEPPSGASGEVDRNERLRRLYYGEAPEEHLRRVRLGHAVAASSAVPGLFPPLVLDGLYDGRSVRLADGGVHDNQGVCALLDEGCELLIISDASGQMDTEPVPGAGILSVPLRSNSILQARVREAAFDGLAARQEGGALRRVVFVHLKKELDARSVTWIGGTPEPGAPAAPEHESPTTSYGISRRVQACLAAVRTDLDSFTDTEAYALMTSGYRMMERELAVTTAWPVGGRPAEWPFLAVEEAMRPGGEGYCQLLDHLTASRHRGFKAWRTVPALRHAVSLVIAAVALIGLYLLWSWRHELWIPGAVLGVSLVPAVHRRLPRRKKRLGRTSEWLERVLFGLTVGTVGWIFAWLHVKIIDRAFLSSGRVKGGP